MALRIATIGWVVGVCLTVAAGAAGTARADGPAGSADPAGYVELAKPVPIRAAGPAGTRIAGKLRAYSDSGFVYLTSAGELHAASWSAVPDETVYRVMSVALDRDDVEGWRALAARLKQRGERAARWQKLAADAADRAQRRRSLNRETPGEPPPPGGESTDAAEPAAAPPPMWDDPTFVRKARQTMWEAIARRAGGKVRRVKPPADGLTPVHLLRMNYNAMRKAGEDEMKTLATDLAMAELLLAERRWERRWHGLGMASEITRYFYYDRKEGKTAALIADALLMPNLDAANPKHWHLYDATEVIEYARSAYEKARLTDRRIAAARLQLKHAYNWDVGEYARMRLSQALEADGQYAAAIEQLEAIDARGSLRGARARIEPLKKKLAEQLAEANPDADTPTDTPTDAPPNDTDDTPRKITPQP